MKTPLRKYTGKFTPKQITYRGTKFRSQLEVKWAMSFDAIGLSWKYEECKLRDSSGKIIYVPDFYMTSLDCFIEIKPTEPTREEIEKCNKLMEEFRKTTFIFCGNLPIPYDNFTGFSVYDGVGNKIPYFFGGSDLSGMKIMHIENARGSYYALRVSTIFTLTRNVVIRG